jgi:hypothetical protein
MSHFVEKNISGKKTINKFICLLCSRQSDARSNPKESKPTSVSISHETVTAKLRSLFFSTENNKQKAICNKQNNKLLP